MGQPGRLGVRANDPAVLAAAAGITATCAFAASVLPARRAARIEGRGQVLY